MPQLKRYKKKKRTSKKKRVYPSWASMNRRIGGWINRELKYYDINTNAVIPTGAGNAHTVDPPTQLCLFAPVQGSGQSNRDGNLATVYEVEVSGKIVFEGTLAGTLPPPTQYVRIMLLLDRQTNGTQATGGDVLEIPPAPFDINSFERLENSERFWLIKDRYFTPRNSSMTQNGGANYSSMIIEEPFRMKHRFTLGLKTRFLSNAGTIADIKDNSLHVFALATPNTANQLIYSTRVRFAG
jgi:hypothetical protein